MASDTEANIDQSIKETSTDAQIAAETAVAPPKNIYKLDPATKIPVSRFEGPVWKSRKTAGVKLLSPLMEGWNEAELYYNNSQMNHRRSTEGDQKGNDVVSKNRNKKYSMTDNMVYATVNAVLPSTYAKNPTVEVTMVDDAMEKVGVALEHFCNNLAARKDAPGVNLKPKVRKSIIRCEITNEAWAMIGYTQRENSAEQARGDIERIGQALEKASDEKEIERLEGELMALEESCDLLDPSGPFIRTVRGDQVIIDPGSTEDDHSDANWMMVAMYMATNYLNARYRQKGKDGEYTSAYKASHIVDARDASNGAELQREIDNFHIFSEGKDNPQDYGYHDRQTYDRAKRTKAWYCFDKVKRRFYLYSDDDWTWPVWVFNDPYNLPMFFPLVKLMYHSDPKRNRTAGEVSHYLDQQDSLNEIADELNRSRTAARDKVLFDSSILDQTTVENLLLDPNRKALGVKLPEGKKLEELISPPPLPALEYQHLWDKNPIMASINQISGIGEAQRGEQFKTNTTNQAIEFYSSVSGVRLDEKRDAIEDFVGEIMYNIMFMCMQFMPVETFIEIAGSEHAPALSQMRNMAPPEIRKLVRMRVAGGSTQKPTSAAKKSEALQMAQVLGQFASGMPAAGIVALKVMQRAFDSLVITDADWDFILQTVMMQMQKAGAGPQGAEGGAEGEGQDSGEEDQLVQEVMARAEQQGTPVGEDEARASVQKRLGNGKPAPSKAKSSKPSK